MKLQSYAMMETTLVGMVARKVACLLKFLTNAHWLDLACSIAETEYLKVLILESVKLGYLLNNVTMETT